MYVLLPGTYTRESESLVSEQQSLGMQCGTKERLTETAEPRVEQGEDSKMS